MSENFFDLETPKTTYRNIMWRGMLLWENNQQHGSVMHANMNQSYSYLSEVDYFLITACPGLIYSSYTTAVLQQLQFLV